MEVNPNNMKSKDQVESKKKKKNKEKKEKHQNIMKQLPSSAYSCSTHQDDFLRLTTKGSKNPPNCKSCGFKLQGKSGYLCCPQSNSCFQLCSSCKVCPSNHNLRNVISLKQFTDNELHSQNKFKCHGCKTEKTVNSEKGVFHCQPCTFSICSDCFDKSESIWENVQIEKEQQ